MVVSSIKRGFAALLMGIAGIAASPAMANNASAAAEIPAPVRSAQSTATSSGGEQFQRLFADWQSLGGDAKTNIPAPVASISIPSRMPLDNAALTSNYGMRTHPVLGGRRRHKGVDLAAPTGTPIYATADGIISKAQRFSSYGLYVSIEHGAQLQTRFAHMSRIAVANGQRVSRGDIIGYVGSTGRSTGPHLHYEVRVAGQAVNPIPYMVESEAQQEMADATQTAGARGGE